MKLLTMFPNKLFVKENGKSTQETVPNKFNSRLSTGLNGEEARNFYDEIITSPLECKKKKIRRPAKEKKCVRLPKEVAPSTLPNPKSLFQLAESNNAKLLQHLLLSGVDHNMRDSFGWTSLMCAACSGAEESVRVLLNAGADVKARDPGYDAVYLAKKNGHTKIVKILLNGIAPPRQATSSQLNKSTPSNCDICNQTYTTTKLKHDASTPHLLAVNSKKTRTFYGIPDSNKGFQMLVRRGWDRERGLGPEGSGRKFPVKVTQKKDRSGIGATIQLKNNQRIVMENKTTILKQNRQSSRLKDRAFERNFRREFC